MTSSSDHPGWVPGSLSAEGATEIAPSFADLSVTSTPSAAPAWLRPLRTTFEEQLEVERARQRIAAYRRGVDETTRKERDLADQRCASALLAVKRVADHLETVATEFARDRERDLHGLAVAVARQIVQHELMIDPLRVGELLRRALELLPLDTTIEVRLNPDDLATLGTATDRLVPAGRAVRLQWLADPGLEPGNFVIESPQRIVDGRSDVALRDLYERLEHE
jgi:flagellar biosynthesis/type III secretory pathway protein FliH